MNKNPRLPVLLGLLACAASFAGAFALACRIVPAEGGAAEAEYDGGIMARMLGGARGVLSQELYEEADRFFHKGIGHFEKQAITNDFFQNLLLRITPARHVHLHGSETREIMPWLYYAHRADSRNMDASLVAAFWLATELKKPDAAEEVLLEAMRRNPRDYRPHLERGRMFARLGDDEKALAAFESALRLWPVWQGASFEKSAADIELQKKIDKAEIFSYLGLLNEKRGAFEAAATAFQEALKLFPAREGIRDRLVKLEKGEADAASAADALKKMTAAPRHKCEMEAAEAGHRH